MNTASVAEAGRFIALGDDYNGRCENYRFDEVSIAAVKEEVEVRRAVLEREGVALIRTC